MKVALVVPKTENVIGANLPLNLGYIASYLKKTYPDTEIKLFDGLAGDDPEKLIFDFHPDIVGVTATTPQILAAYKLADMLNQKMPDILTVIGGVHCSALPNEASLHFDVVIVGEGEKAFADIVFRFQNKQNIPKIMYGESEECLDSLPMPDYSLFRMDFYLSDSYLVNYKHLGLTGLTTMMITSRGCPFKCVFCYNSGRTGKVRYRSAKKIVEEILYLHETYDVTGVLFVDDEFLINIQRLREFKKLIKENGMDKWFRFICQARTTTFNVVLLELIKSMGCVLLNSGFESGCEKTLLYLKTGTVQLKDNQNALEVAKTVGINVLGYFIVGSPNETLTEMQLTQKFIENSSLSFAALNALTPYPGTQLWYDCKQQGLIPENINYDTLISSVTENAFTVTMLPQKVFYKFLDDCKRSTGTVLSIRKTYGLKTFFANSPRKDLRYMWIHHPLKMFRELRFLINKRFLEKI